MIKKALALLLIAAQVASAAVISRTYTYTAGTVIDPTQVNTNESTIYTDYNGNIDSTNIAANGIAYSNLSTAIQTIWAYRRPVLQYNSGTVVNIETGINGTSGQLQIIFPDGTKRTDSTSSRIQCNIAQNAILTGTTQGGLRTGSASANTWYAFYAVKSQANSTDILCVIDTVIPTQANYATLNTNLGANSWVYLGELPYGDNSGATTAFPKFNMAANRITFRNSLSSATTARGIRLATTGGATSLTWSYAAGTALGSGQIPSQIIIGTLAVDSGAQTTANLLDSGASIYNAIAITATSVTGYSVYDWPLTDGAKANFSGSVAAGISLTSYFDGALGIGFNPQL